jgi:hypothetical protein
MATRPTQLSKSVIFLLVGLLLISFMSGLGLWYVHELRESQSELPAWTNACRIVHGIVNPAICVLFGFLWFNHIRGGWKMRVNRPSGSTLTISLVILIISGAGLYYGDESRHFWFTVHLIPGLLLAIILPAHWLAARKWVRSLENRDATNPPEQRSTVENTR